MSRIPAPPENGREFRIFTLLTDCHVARPPKFRYRQDCFARSIFVVLYVTYPGPPCALRRVCATEPCGGIVWGALVLRIRLGFYEGGPNERPRIGFTLVIFWWEDLS